MMRGEESRDFQHFIILEKHFMKLVSDIFF